MLNKSMLICVDTEEIDTFDSFNELLQTACNFTAIKGDCDKIIYGDESKSILAELQEETSKKAISNANKLIKYFNRIEDR